MTHALELSGVWKRYASHVAVEDLTLAVPAGSIFGVLGPNGAGKSTTIRVAMNIVARDGGTVRLLGSDPAVEKEVLRRVGYLPEERGLYRKMRVLDVLVFFGRLKGMERRAARAVGLEWLERLGLGAWGGARVDQLSKGMQQKVQFITTVMHEPDLLILDEPASGLDPVNQEVLRATIRRARDAGRTVVLSTHNMKEAEELCDAVCIIAEGRKVLEGSVRALRRAGAGNRWLVEYEEPPEGVREALAALASGGAVHPTGEGWELELPIEQDPGRLFTVLGALERKPYRLVRIEPSLHEIFVARVGDAAARPVRRG